MGEGGLHDEWCMAMRLARYYKKTAISRRYRGREKERVGLRGERQAD